MAKRKQQSLDIDVKGLTTEEILNMDVNDINKMNYRTIRALGSRLVSSMNKRIRSLSKKAPYSQALNSLPVNFQFSIKGKGRNEIRSIIGDMIRFGQMRSSTISGYKAYRRNIEQKLGGSLSNLRDESEFWKVYRELQESNHAIFQKLSSDEILKLTYDEMIENPTDGLGRIQQTLDDIYESFEGGLEGEDLLDEIFDEYDEDDEDYF